MMAWNLILAEKVLYFQRIRPPIFHIFNKILKKICPIYYKMSISINKLLKIKKVIWNMTIHQMILSLSMINLTYKDDKIIMFHQGGYWHNLLRMYYR